ncbi:hypothetical protein GE107_19950 [Cohnella sp. CFH 77786]|uniref:GyrI-like domain-containing protein n=1 Tax=Cohnella sp. CFH 77786 TaxID=2662265 RepID=UPI001C60CF3C|nr:hypothetical protein [Cohnella sp. CFH 77786]
MNVDIVARPEMKAAALRIPRDGARVRQAWKEISGLLDGHPNVADREHGLVFIPEWQWATEVTTLWVGIEVSTFDNLPPGLERIAIPAKKFAKVTVKGDRARMNETYHFLGEWFRNGPYERDVSEGSLGYEINRLHPVNPFDIPADTIDYFEFDIYAPIKEGVPDEIRSRYPGIIGTVIRKGVPLKIVGLESFVNQRGQKPEIVIPRLWQEQFMPRIGEIADRLPPYATIGLYQYEPPFGPGQDFRYLAGVEVDPHSAAPLPEGMTARTIPGDDRFVVTYRGKASGFGQVWDYFHGYWRQTQSEYEAIDDYEFERHDARYQGVDNENSVFELHFPIRKRVQETRLTDKT